MTDNLCSHLPPPPSPSSSVISYSSSSPDLNEEFESNITPSNYTSNLSAEFDSNTTPKSSPTNLPFPRQSLPINKPLPKFSSFGSYRQRHGDPLPSNPIPSLEAPPILSASSVRGGLSIALADHRHPRQSDSASLISPTLPPLHPPRLVMPGSNSIRLIRAHSRARAKSSDLDRELAWQRKIKQHQLEEEEERKRKELELMHQNMVASKGKKVGEGEGIDTEEEINIFDDTSGSSDDDSEDDESDDSFPEEDEDEDDHDVSNEFKDKITLSESLDIPQIVHGVNEEDQTFIPPVVDRVHEEVHHTIHKANEEHNYGIAKFDRDNPRKLTKSIHGDRPMSQSARLPSHRFKSRMDVTDEDLEELEGSIDLGFEFNLSYDEGSRHLKNTLPALELYHAINKNYVDGGMPSPMSSMEGSGLGRTISIDSNTSIPSIPLEETYRISSPGDRRSLVKTRLRHWAKVVAFSLREGL